MAGGLLLRAYVEQCNDPPVRTLLTLGSPHAGVTDIPHCEEDSISCTLMRSAIKNGVYWPWVQQRIVQAQYYKQYNSIIRTAIDSDFGYDYRDSQLSNYYEKNIFLPDLNQEGPNYSTNAQYKARFLSLDMLVLVRFEEDETVKPRDSAWFSFPDKDGLVIGVRDSEWYEKGGAGD